MLGCVFCRFLCREGGSADLGDVIGKVEALGWMSEVSVSVPRPGVIGVVLTRMALRRRKKIYATVLHMFAMNGRGVL